MSEDLRAPRPGRHPSQPVPVSDDSLTGANLVHVWLLGLVKTIKASRLYNENSELRQRFAHDSLILLEHIFTEMEELTLFVREDRLVFEGEDVLVQPDRQEGLPFVLYRNAFRRITFRPGWTYEQLTLFMLVLNQEMVERDPTKDLVSQFWNLALPSLSYVTIDSVLSASNTAADDAEKQEIEDLQEEIENILSAIYESANGDDDFVENLNIDHLDLLALQKVSEEEDDADELSRTTARAILGIEPAELERVRDQARRGLSDREVIRRLSRIFADLLGRATDAKDSVAAGMALLQIVDRLLEERDWDFLVEFVGYLRGERLAQQPGARYAVDQLTSNERLGVLLTALVETSASVSFSRVTALVSALGASAIPVCLDTLVRFREPAQRRAMVDLLIEIGVSDPNLILSRFGASEWFVDRDLLALAASLPAEQQAAVILKGLEHDNAQVRIAAVAQLRGFREGTADRLLARMLSDPDLSVRLAAIRVAAARKSQPCLPALRDLISSPEFAESDPRLMRLATLAYARLAGDAALAVLGPMMRPGLLASFRSMDAPLAAVVAVGAIGTPAAKELLEQGRKSLNRALKDACQRALQGAQHVHEDLEPE